MDLESRLMDMLRRLEAQIQQTSDEKERLQLIKQWNATLSKLLQLKRMSKPRKEVKRIELLGANLTEKGLEVKCREVVENGR